MASNVRKLAVEILGDASGAQKAMRAVEDSSQSLGDNIGRLAKGMAGAFATQQIAAFAKDAVGAAMEDVQAQSLLARQLKVSTGATDKQVAAVEEFIQKTQNSTGVLDDELRPALATFVRFTGDAQKAQELLTLAMDISTSTGKDLGTVSTALARAYNGNSGALARLGVQTKDAAGEALSFDQIQTQLNKTFGGATAAAADTAAGKMRIAQANFADLKEEVGMSLIPVLGTLVDTIKPVIDAFLALPDGAQQAIVFGGLAVSGFGAARTALTNFGVAAGSATKMLGGAGLALGGLMVISKIFAADTANATVNTEGFTNALKENDKALRASKLNELAADDPNVRSYLKTMAEFGLTIDDLAEYAKTGGGRVAYFRQEISNIGGLATNTRQQFGRLGAEMGVFVDTTKMTDIEVQNLRGSTYDFLEALFNMEQDLRDAKAGTDATASGLLGMALEGEDAADALDEVTGAAFELTEQWKQTLGFFDQKQAWNNLTDSIGDLAEAQAAAFGDPSQENTRKYEEALADVYDKTANYIEALGDVPAEKQTEILALLNSGDVLAVAAELDTLTKQRVIPIRLGELDIETRRALNLQPRANGGNVAPGVSYVVGERGPELFVPSSSGTVVPRIPATMGGANTYSITVNTNGVADPSAIGAQVVDAIRAYERRNGNGWRR